MAPLALLTAATASLTGTAMALPGTETFRRPQFSLYVFGTFGGATVQLQASPDGINWVNVPSGATTGTVIMPIDLQAAFVRAVVTNATGTTNISATLI